MIPVDTNELMRFFCSISYTNANVITFIAEQSMVYLKKLAIILPFFFLTVLANQESSQVKLQVSPKQHAKMKLSLMVVGSGQEMESIAALVKKALEFSGQWAVDQRSIEQLPTKKEIVNYGKRVYPM